MPEVTLEEVPQKVRDLFNRGFTAMERGNLDYAIDMFTASLHLEPLFHRARKFLRAAEVKRHMLGGTHALAAFTGPLTSLPAVLSAHALVRSGKPMQALERIEKALRGDPLNPALVQAFGQAAEAAGEPEIAILTLQIVRDHKPQDTAILNWLGHLYMKTDQHRLARECFEKLVELLPHDGAALKSLKDSMALDSMAKDGWSETAATGGTFRRMIKDQKEAQILEQESKAVKTQRDIESLIAENLSKIQREPKNVNYRRALANLYATSGMFAEAIKALEDALVVANERDPQIDNALSQVRLQQFEHQIAQLRAGGNTAAADQMAREMEEFRFRDVQDRVTRYPNDLQLKYDYGLLLFGREQINEAIQQFQIAQRSPQFRISALYHIGVCFKNKKQYDLAADQLTRAAADVPGMDDQKKEILYELAQVMEALGERDKALEHYKQIYQVDITYRDVANKVERDYRKNAG